MQISDAVDIAKPATISPAVAAAAGPEAAAAAEAAAAYVEDDEVENTTADQLQTVLQQQHVEDEAEKQQDKQPPEECRRDWRAAMRWALQGDGQDLLDPAYEEAAPEPNVRTVTSAPLASVDPIDLAAEFNKQLPAVTPTQQVAAALKAAALPAGDMYGVGLQPNGDLQQQIIMQRHLLQQQLLLGLQQGPQRPQ